jgi:hypothetical protein
VNRNRPGAHDNGNYIAGMDVMGAEDWHIHDNTFVNIRGATGGGRAAVFLWRSGKNCVVENNVFINCDRAVAFGNSQDADSRGESYHMQGGLCANNFIVAGAGRTLEFCDAENCRAYHNSIFNQAVDGAAFNSTVWIENSRNVALKNNLIMGNVKLYDRGSVDSSSNIHNAVQSWFQNVSTGDLHLTTLGSRAVDAGITLSDVSVDYDYCARTTPPDIGADEFDENGCDFIAFAEYSMHEPFLAEPVVQVFPNPFNTSTNIQVLMRNAECGMMNVYVDIFDIHGRFVGAIGRGGVLTKNANNLRTPPLQRQFRIPNSAFGNSFTWVTSNQPAGTYLIRIKAGNNEITKKAILRK